MIKERNIKTENSSVYYRSRTQKHYEKKKHHPEIVKINKICERKGKWKIRKAHSEREKVKWDPNQDYQKTTPNKEIQNKNLGLLRCKSAKCHNERYKYKTKECLELCDKLHHLQQGREENTRTERKKLQSCI